MIPCLKDIRKNLTIGTMKINCPKDGTFGFYNAVLCTKDADECQIV